MTDLMNQDSRESQSELLRVRAVVVSPPRETAAVVADTNCAVAGAETSLQRYVDNRLLVVSMMLVVGPLGLPLIWLNRRFSIWSKIGWTVVFVLFTVVLPIALVWYWCNTAMQPLLEAFGV